MVYTVSQLRTNIIPPAEISQSIIEKKTKAVQEAQASIAKKKIVADAEAQEKNCPGKGVILPMRLFRLQVGQKL